MLNEHLQQLVRQSTGASAIVSSHVVQSLWSGYGEIVRLELVDASIPSVVLKYISFPETSNHPRGWNTNVSHQRKIRSYDIEMHWYRDWSDLCDEDCRVARCYAAESIAEDSAIVLEDLDVAGYPRRKSTLDKEGVKLCLHWLANFHARFLCVEPEGLWPIGTYWHLDTRQDEFATMEEGKLKRAAKQIDDVLNQCQFKTLVHGDAKVANFCFSNDMTKVAAVDFQYVGGGCGMKDVAYFLGSCLDSQQCEDWQDEMLAYYFKQLFEALDKTDHAIDKRVLEAEWRRLFPVAWTDFYRFMLGWMPTHQKINNYTKRLAEKTLEDI